MLLTVVALCVAKSGLPAWNKILGQPVSAIDRALGAPARKSSTLHNIYDPRWVKWTVVKHPNGPVVEQTLEIVWRYPDDVVHDADLHAGRIPMHAQAKGNWIAYLGSPLANFGKVAGEPLKTETNEEFGIRIRQERYSVKGIGEADTEAVEFQRGKPILTRVLLHLGPKANLDATLNRLKIDRKAWKQMDRDLDPNTDVYLRYRLGQGDLIEREYAIGSDERLLVYFDGPAGKETARQFTFYSDRLTGLLDGVRRFAFPLTQKDVTTMPEAQTYWGLHYMAIYTFKPSKQLTIGVRNFDPNDLN